MRDNFETIQLERKGDHLLVVTLNRPKASNSMNTLMGKNFETFGLASIAIKKTYVVPSSRDPVTESSALVQILKSATG